MRLVAHELSHQWFGNSLTLGSWQDIWLHEGFACYAEWIWSEESGGPSAHERAEEHHEKLADLDQDLVLADPGPELMFDDRVYKRGALTLHALRLTVGDDAFFALLRGWTDRARPRHRQHRGLRRVRGAVDRTGPGRALRRLAQPSDPPGPASCTVTSRGRTGAAPCHRRGQVGGQRHVHHPVRPRHRRRPLHDHR